MYILASTHESLWWVTLGLAAMGVALWLRLRDTR